jgi:hypothetical protein
MKLKEGDGERKQSSWITITWVRVRENEMNSWSKESKKEEQPGSASAQSHGCYNIELMSGY